MPVSDGILYWGLLVQTRFFEGFALAALIGSLSGKALIYMETVFTLLLTAANVRQSAPLPDVGEQRTGSARSFLVPP